MGLLLLFLVAAISTVRGEKDLPSTDLKILREAKTCYIVVQYDCGEAQNVSLPFTAVVSRLLACAGIHKVAEKATADFSLHISAKGSTRPEQYRLSQNSSRKCMLWPDAYLAGEISLLRGERILRTWPFHGEASKCSSKGPFVVFLRPGKPPTSPEDAPFEVAFRKGFIPVATRILGEIWGPEALVRALASKGEIHRSAYDNVIAMGGTAVPVLAAAYKRGLSQAIFPLDQIETADAVDPFLLLLQEKDPRLRVVAARALGKIEDPKAIPALVAALGDDENQVRQSATGSLRRWKDEQTAKRIAEALGARQVPLHEAMSLLKDMGELAIAPLEELLTADDDDTVEAGARVLGMLDSSSSVEALLAAIRNPQNGNVRYNVVRALIKIGDRRAIPHFAALLPHESGMREMLLETLIAWKADDEKTAEAVAVCLDDISRIPETRALLLQMGPTAVPALRKALQERKDALARYYAAKILGEIGDRRAVVPLIAALKDKPQARYGAIMALGQIGDEQALDPLIEVLAHSDPQSRKLALEALKKITGKDFGKDPDSWRRWAEARPSK